MRVIGFLLSFVRRDISMLVHRSSGFSKRRLSVLPLYGDSLPSCQRERKVIGQQAVTEFLLPCSGLSVFARGYAKGKDKKKEKGKQKVVVDENYLAQFVRIDKVKGQMQHAVDHLKTEYVQTLSLRSTSGAIENLPVHFEGNDFTIQELGQVVRKDSKTVIINLTAFPQAIPAVLETLQKSGMNLSIQQDGTTLFIPVPRVTVEHKEKLAKSAKALFLKCRDSLKDIQNKQVKALKDKDDVAKDDLFNVQQQLGTLADSFIGNADVILQIKLKELGVKE